MGQTWCPSWGIVQRLVFTDTICQMPCIRYTVYSNYLVCMSCNNKILPEAFQKLVNVLDRKYIEDSQIVPCFPLSRRVTAQIIFRIRRKVGSPAWNMKLFYQPTLVITRPNSQPEISSSQGYVPRNTSENDRKADNSEQFRHIEFEIRIFESWFFVFCFAWSPIPTPQKSLAQNPDFCLWPRHKPPGV